MSLRQRVFRGVLWSAGLSVANQGPTFFLGILLARMLGKQVFGEWGMVQNTILAVSNVAQLAVAVTATKFVAELRHSDPARVGRVLGVCSLVTLITGALAALALLLAAGVTANEVLHAPHLKRAVQISVGTLFFVTVNGYQIGALSGLEAFDRLAVLGAVNGVLTVAGVAMAARVAGLHGALLAMGVVAGMTWVLHHVILRRCCQKNGIQVSHRGLGSEMAVLTGFAFPATLSGLAGSAGIWLSNVALVRIEHGYEEMAVLSAGMTLRAIVLFAPSVISRVSTPILVNLVGNQRLGTYRDAYAKNLWVLTIAATTVAVPLAALARYLLLAFGKNYRDGAPVVAVLALSAVFEVVALGLYQQIYSTGRMWWSVLIVASRSALLLSFSFVLAPRLGALGLAWAYAVAYGGSLLLTHAIVKFKIPLAIET